MQVRWLPISLKNQTLNAIRSQCDRLELQNDQVQRSNPIALVSPASQAGTRYGATIAKMVGRPRASLLQGHLRGVVRDRRQTSG